LPCVPPFSPIGVIFPGDKRYAAGFDGDIKEGEGAHAP
jgi:hypothetical protein